MKKYISLFLAATIALAAPSASGGAVPETKPLQTGVSVKSNSKGTIDLSNANEGYVLCKYTGGKSAVVRVQIFLSESNKYNYYLNTAGDFEAFPFSEGDGKYTVKILELNPSSGKYATVYACTVDVKLRNPLLPFLYSNAYVNYANAGQSVKKAVELVKSCKTALEKVETIYKYVTSGISYDKDFAAKVISGEITSHVPDLDATLKSKKGVCFDYAALMAGMLRSQGVPVRLVLGYAGTTYHAWINVYIPGTGWIDKVIYFDGENWTMMDPTFVSSSKNADAVNKFIGGGKSYSEKQYY